MPDPSTNPMRPSDWAHVESVNERQTNLTRNKYCEGRKFHGGDCWAKPGMLAHAQDEAADLPVYLWTLRDQLTTLAAECEQRGELVTAARIRFMLRK